MPITISKTDNRVLYKYRLPKSADLTVKPKLRKLFMYTEIRRESDC